MSDIATITTEVIAYRNIGLSKRADDRKAQEVRAVIKGDPKPDIDTYIESHELSLLSLLVRKHPQKATEFVRKAALDGVK